jgi:hypothetical protein
MCATVQHVPFSLSKPKAMIHKNFTREEAVALAAKMDASNQSKKPAPVPANESFQDKLLRLLTEKGISHSMARTTNVRTQDELDAALVVIENDWKALNQELQSLGLAKPIEDKNQGFIPANITKADIEAWATRTNPKK